MGFGLAGFGFGRRTGLDGNSGKSLEWSSEFGILGEFGLGILGLEQQLVVFGVFLLDWELGCMI